MSKSNLRCFGVIVVYDPYRAKPSVERFHELIKNSFENFVITIVSNNPKVYGHTQGSNYCGEFSGWAEGLKSREHEDFDLILFANDTFSTKRTFGSDEQKKFIDTVLYALKAKKPFLVGGLSWHINYSLLLKKNKFLLKWVRTDLFAISPEALSKIGGISLADNEISSLVVSDKYGNFILSKTLPEVIRFRIQDWLHPKSDAIGWHSADQAPRSIKKLKAKCILQEIDLTMRCLKARVSIYSTVKVEKRDYVFKLLFYLQERFLYS